MVLLWLLLGRRIQIDGKVGDFIITARRKGADWYIGAMTDWTSREFTVDLNFLSEGNYEATICEDGINADRYPSDYTLAKKQITKDSTLTIRMAPGGGNVVRLRKIK